MNQQHREPVRFIGAKLPGWDASYERLKGATTFPIDLREATVEGSLNVSHATVESALQLSGATVHGDLVARNTQFKRKFNVSDTDLKGAVDCRDARFDRSVSFSNAEVRGDVRLQDTRFDGSLRARDAVFHGPVALHGAVINADLQFTESRFRGHTNFERVTVHDDAIFNRTRFGGGIRLRQADIDAEVSFTDATITDTAIFTEASFAGDADFRTTTFDGRTDFRRVSFQDVSFLNAVFHAPTRFDRVTVDRAVFNKCTFDELASFQAVRVQTEFIFDQVRITEVVRFDRSQFDGHVSMTAVQAIDGPVLVDCSEATFERGAVGTREGTDVVFDFAGATIKNVSLSTADPSDPDVSSPFDRYRFLRTTFDGFDFSDYNDVLLEAQWQIHGTRHIDFGTKTLSDPSNSDLEKTYLKAKNGAAAAGATQAEAEFFRKQLIYRRREYCRRLSEGGLRTLNWWKLLYRYVANTIFNATSGYGERPSYTFVTALFIIFGFTGLFWVLLPEPPYDGGWPDYFYLSMESFVSLIIGTPSIDSAGARLLAGFQGFLGGFLIALLVFALTRSVYR